MKRREFNSMVTTGSLATGLGIPFSASAGSTDKGKAAGAESDLDVYPVYTTAERDRRWHRVRNMMSKHGVDCLLVFGDFNPLNNRSPDNYLSNDIPNSIVIFPLEGEPAGIGGPGFMAANWLQADQRNEGGWIKEWYFRPGLNTISEIIESKGYLNAKIGTVGGRPPGGGDAMAGATPPPLPIQKLLPEAGFVDVSRAFTLLWLVKGEEELTLFRHVSGLVESACKVMLDVSRAGVYEAKIYADVQYEILRHGGKSHAMLLQTGLPAHLPRWHARSQGPRSIRQGDVVNAELFAYLGTMQAQANMSISIGKPDKDTARAASLAREIYQIGLEELRPGRLFGDVALAMRAPLQREGGWHLTPLIHTLNPQEYNGPSFPWGQLDSRLTERFGKLGVMPMMGEDLVIEPGMLFNLESNACVGLQRVNVGSNVIITSTGIEVLNRIPTRMHISG